MDECDHRNLSVKHKLWHLQEDAPGMVFWHPRGTAIYRVLADYLRHKMRGIAAVTGTSSANICFGSMTTTMRWR
jgi:threonyl-tRNA synthetase